MPQLTIVGLGPGSLKQLTCEAWEVLTSAGEIWVRTGRHPIVAQLPPSIRVHSFDSVYEETPTFDEIYAIITDRVLELAARAEGVIYAVPGHPMVGESTVARLRARAADLGLPVRLVDGLSFIEPSLSALHVDALDGLQIVDALDLVTLNHPPLNPDFPALVGQVYSRNVASNLKLVLMNQYPDEHPVALVSAAGTDMEVVQQLALYEIDHDEPTALTSLYLAPLPAVAGFEGFQETVARLRSPEGCPWDREQTHASLRNSLLEESYEVLAAIDAEDSQALCEELGDLLLQIVLHAQIAVEEGEFQMPDVIAAIDAKMKHRHPHVWGATEVGGVADVLTNWEAIKHRERQDAGNAERSLLDGVPSALPALAQAQAYGERAARVGVGRQGESEAHADLHAVLRQFGQDLAPENRALAVGRLLLAVVNLARCWGLDAESSLREVNARFAQRFRALEAAALQQATDIGALPGAAPAELWDCSRELS